MKLKLYRSKQIFKRNSSGSFTCDFTSWTGGIHLLIREVIWNAPKSISKLILSCDGIYIFIWNAPKSKNWIFFPLAVCKLGDFYLKCQIFLCSKYLEHLILPPVPKRNNFFNLSQIKYQEKEYVWVQNGLRLKICFDLWNENDVWSKWTLHV